MDEGLKNKCQDRRKIQVKTKTSSVVNFPEGKYFNTKKEHQTQGAKGVRTVMTVGLRDTYASHDLKQHSRLHCLKSVSLCLE